MPGLTVRDLTMEFSSGGYAVRPIDGLDLDVKSGELVQILGFVMLAGSTFSLSLRQKIPVFQTE